MKATVEAISPIKKKLHIEIPFEDFLSALDKSYKKLSNQVSIKGFRKGKVPRAILEQHYKDQTESDVLSHLLEDSYTKALEEQRIEAVSSPAITDLKKENSQPISFTAEVEVRPAVVLTQYKGFNLNKPSIEAGEDEIEKELHALHESHAQLTPVSDETSLEKGNIAFIDFTGRIDGETIEGGQAENFQLEVGKGVVLKDLDEGIVGMKKGETRKVPVQFPADYPYEKAAGKRSEFEVTLKEIKAKTLPELNDDFARDLGDFDSLDKVKQKLKEAIQSRKEQEARGSLHQQIVENLITQHPMELPNAMVDRELEAMLENFKNRLRHQRLTFQETGLTPEAFFKENRELAIRRVKAFLLFEAVAQAEKIEVKPEELKERLEQIAKSMNQNVEVVERYYHEQRMLPLIALEVLERKTLDFLIAESKV